MAVPAALGRTNPRNSCELSRSPRIKALVKAPSTRTGFEVEALVRRHQGSVRGFLVFLGCPPDRLDDLVQDVFLSVLSSGFEYRGDAATAAYLRKVARHLFLKAMQRDRRQVLLADPGGIEVAWVEFERDDGGRGYLAALRECLKRIRGRAAQVLRLRYELGLGPLVIAERIELSESGVKSILVRTKKKLRECIEGRLVR